MSNTLGLYGNIFVDYGLKHKIKEAMLKQPYKALTIDIGTGEETKITFEVEDDSFDCGDFIMTKNIEGIDSINKRPLRINKIMNIPNKKNWFSILVDFNSIGKGVYQHSSYSYFIKFIAPQIKNYLSFEESLVNYSKINKDINQSKPITSRELHLIFLTLISMKSPDGLDGQIFLENLTMINEKLKSKNNNVYSSRVCSGVSHSQFLNFMNFVAMNFIQFAHFLEL